MRTLVDACVLVVLCTLYWCNRKRRKHLKERVGRLALSNVYRVGRNVGYMLAKKPLSVQGERVRLQPGSILYSFHYGVWELMPRTLDRLGYHVGIVVNRYGGDSRSAGARLADSMLRRYRTAGRVLILHKEETLKMVRLLKSGGILGVLVDGDSPHAKYPPVARLGRICRAPLVPFAAYTENGQGILDIGCDIDALLKRRPLDYVWFYRSRHRKLHSKA